MQNSDDTLEKHLKEEHAISPFSTYLKEIVYGGIDGIVTTFAVVAGFSGAQSAVAMTNIPIIAVVLFGMANLFGDAASMGLGNFLSIRADQDVYNSEKKKELHEIRTNKESELKETAEILLQKGFSKNDADTMTKLYAKNEDYWVEFMMRYELEMQNPTHEKPLYNALATFFSFIVFGIIPLLPYLLHFHETSQFGNAIAYSVLALIMLGLLRFKVTNINLMRSIGETLIMGSVAGGVAYFVGMLFRGV